MSTTCPQHQLPACTCPAPPVPQQGYGQVVVLPTCAHGVPAVGPVRPQRRTDLAGMLLRLVFSKGGLVLLLVGLFLALPYSGTLGRKYADLKHDGIHLKVQVPTITTRPIVGAQATTIGGGGKGGGVFQPPPAPKGLTFTTGAGCNPAVDWASPRLDRRIRAALTAAAATRQVRVSCLRTGHSKYVAGTRRVSNHTVWRGADIDRVDGHPVRVGNAAAKDLAGWLGRGLGGARPWEVGSPWEFPGRPWFTDEAHDDHIHLGFAAPTQAGS